MNLLDLLIVLLVVTATAWGLATGVAVQVGAYVGLGAGLALGAVLAPHVSGLVHTAEASVALTLLTVLGMGVILASLGERIGARAASVLRRAHLGGADAAAGGLFAGIAQLLIVWLLAASVASAPLGGLGQLIQGSWLLNELDQVMPPVPAVMARLGRLVDPLGFPRVFVGLEPSPGPPVGTPGDEEVAALSAGAGPSTVKVEGRGCGGVVDGSGFVVGDHLVITNAHVVAGIAQPAVLDASGRHPATPVAFDPDLDVAVLRVGGLAGPPLTLAGDVADRGASGAVLGYPGGGNFTAVPAAVRSQFTARGRDIYGQGLSTREVYELQARVRPGNSGGPFVLADGTVAGVVFAESLSDSSVSYALTSAEVAPVVAAAAAGTDQRVPTGACAAG
jgi:S1-C subfamily serine protease